MPTRELLEGEKYRFVFWAAREADLDFFCNCPNLTAADQEKIVKALTTYAANGFPDNRQKFKPVEDRLYEIKPTSQLRMVGFFHGKDFVIVLCVRKKQDDLAPKDVKKAKKYRERFYAENDED